MMHGSISFGGNVAKWASGKGWVETVHTERLFLDSWPGLLHAAPPSDRPGRFPAIARRSIRATYRPVDGAVISRIRPSEWAAKWFTLAWLRD